MEKLNKQFDIPILLIMFRRKDTAQQVINVISKVKPQKLYISQDGPRNKVEEKIVKNTLNMILSKINWKCDLTIWTHENNLGLKKHIPEAFDKFFNKEEMGIYLEDDTLPSIEFFYFQKELLEKYKNDKRIFSINGTNFYPNKILAKDSYYLSKLGDIWGFGLWRRSWKLYNSDFNDLTTWSKSSGYRDIFINQRHEFYLETFWFAIKNKKLDSWAMQIIYSALKNNMYFISPSVNLVNNLGSNTTGSNISLQNYYHKFGNPFPINHPKKLIYDKMVDRIYFSQMLKGGWVRLLLIRVYLNSYPLLKLVVNKLISKI